MSREPIRLNDILRRAQELRPDSPIRHSEPETVARSLAMALASGHEILGQLESVVGLLESDDLPLSAVLVSQGTETPQELAQKARQLFQSLLPLFQDIGPAAAGATAPYADLFARLSERLSTVAGDALRQIEAKAQPEHSEPPSENPFPARPSPMTPEEAKAFRRDLRKRTDKILAALAE